MTQDGLIRLGSRVFPRDEGIPPHELDNREFPERPRSSEPDREGEIVTATRPGQIMATPDRSSQAEAVGPARWEFVECGARGLRAFGDEHVRPTQASLRPG